MMIRDHFGFTFVALLLWLTFFWFDIYFIFFFILGAVFIDIDHYFAYLFKEKKYLSLKSVYKRFMKGEYRNDGFENFVIFHNVEFLLFLFVIMKAGFLFVVTFPLFLGVLLHYVLDGFSGFLNKETKRKWSVVVYVLGKYVRRRNKN